MTKPKPENCKNCSSKSAYDCAQLQYTIQHRTVLIISPLLPPDKHHSSDAVYWRGGGHRLTSLQLMVSSFFSGGGGQYSWKACNVEPRAWTYATLHTCSRISTLTQKYIYLHPPGKALTHTPDIKQCSQIINWAMSLQQLILSHTTWHNFDQYCKTCIFRKHQFCLQFSQFE